MAVLLKRRHLDPVLRTASSRRQATDPDSSRNDQSLTPKRLTAVGVSRSTRNWPLGPVKRTSKPRIRSKERPAALLQSEEDRLNHSFSCSQVNRFRSRRGFEAEYLSGEPLDPSIQTVSLKTASSQRRLGQSPDRERALQGEFIRKRDVFEEILRGECSKNRSALKTIKVVYEDYISALEIELSELKIDLQTHKIANSSLQTTVKKLESLATALQTKVQTLKFELDFRIFEARENAEETPADLSSTRDEEVEILKQKMHLCSKLLTYMREKGLPVQETYREMRSQWKGRASQSVLVSLSELEIGGEALKEVNLAGKRPVEVPRILIPPVEDRKPDFQDEFLSKIEEFSESWRLQIAKQQAKHL